MRGGFSTYLLCFVIGGPSLRTRRQETLVYKPQLPILAVDASGQCLAETHERMDCSQCLCQENVLWTIPPDSSASSESLLEIKGGWAECWHPRVSVLCN